MNLRTRLSAALAAALLTAGLSAAADGPAVVAQSQPVGETLALIRTLAEKYGGKEALAKFNDAITDGLGEKGFTGLDLTRPVRGYFVYVEGAEQPGGVVIVPVTTDKEFLDLLKRTKAEVGKVKGADGLYEIVPPESDKAEAAEAAKKVRLRFKGADAYVGFNLPDAELAADKLVAPEAAGVPGPASLLAVRAYFDRVPQAAAAQNRDQMDQLKAMLDGLPVPEELKASVVKLLDTSAKFSERMSKEGESYDVRIDLDPKTDDLTTDVVLRAKKGTELARQIAEYKSPTNRFTNLLGKDTAFGFVTRLPLFTPEIRDTVSEAVKLGVESQEEQIPPPAKPLADEAVAGLLRTIKSGAFDLGLAFHGPDAAGVYGMTFGVSFEDTRGVEKELRDAVKNGPEGAADFVKFDAAKADGVSIHTLELVQLVPPDGKKLFGDDMAFAFAFAPKALYVSVGADAVTRLKGAVGGKLEPAPVAKVVVNGKRVLKLMELTDKPLDDKAKAMFDQDDKLVTAYSLSIEGGEAMTMKSRLRVAPFFLLAGKEVKPLGGPAKLARPAK